MFLSSITKSIMLFNESKTSDLVFWMIGEVHHAQFTHILAILPWFIVSILLITVISNSMDTLKMGDSIAISLGENVKLTKIISTITVILLFKLFSCNSWTNIFCRFNNASYCK